nr:putative ribonuclease H-like domain-containing protein [Tanacetum cinerariifolium]
MDLIHHGRRKRRMLKIHKMKIMIPTANDASIKDNAIDKDIVYGCADDPNMPNLEEIAYSDEDRDVCVEADMTDFDINIHGYTQEEGLYYDEVFAPVARIKAIMLFLSYALFKDFVVYQMDVKSAFLCGKIKEEVYVYQSLRFEDLEFPDRVYKVEKALYGLHQALRAWYQTLSTYLLDNGFHRGQIDKTLFFKRVKGNILLVQVYVDDIIFGSIKKEMCTEFEKMMHKKFQMSSMGELTFFLRLQVTQKDDEIFISQDKHVDKILKKIFRYLKGQPKLGLWYLKDSPFNLEPYTNSDYVGASLDRKSTTGGCQFLRRRLISWQCKKQTIVANYTTVADEIAAKDGIDVHTENADFAKMVDFLNANPIRKTKRKAIKICQSSRPTTLVAYETIHEKREDRVERAATTASSLEAKQDNGDTRSQTRFERLSKQSHGPPLSRVNTLRSGKDSMQLIELMELYTTLSNRVLDLENVKDAQDLEIQNLKKRVKRLEKKRKLRTLQLNRRLIKARIESSAKKSLGDQKDASNQGRNDQDKEILFVQEDSETQRSAPVTTVGVSISTAELSTPLTTITTPIEDEDLTIAQTLMKMRSVKSKEKSKEKGVSSTRLTRGEIMKEAKVLEGSGKKTESSGNEVVSKKRTEEEFNQESSKRQKTSESSKLAKEPKDKEAVELRLTLKALESAGRSSELEIILRDRLYMLVEKEYPLSRGTLTLMLGRIFGFKRLLSAIEVTAVDMEVTTAGSSCIC